MTRVVLHIDRLVLKGLKADEARAVAKSLQDALEERLGNSSGVARLIAYDGYRQLDLGCVKGSSCPRSAGKRIGEHIIGGIKP